MLKNNRKYYYFYLILFIIFVFVLNYNHLNQQGTYENIFKPIANNLLYGKGYTCSFFHNEILFYPIWGYTFLVGIDSLLGFSNYFVLGVQFILCFLSIYTFYKIINVNEKYWHIPLFLPFIALMSVKWPDAIVGALIIFLIYFLLQYFEIKKAKYILCAGIILGVLVNFRSEYLYLPLSFLLLLFISFFKKNRLLIVKSIFLLLLFNIIFLMPWAIRSYVGKGDLRLTASNGGAVLFISLGQLPNNPWGITPYDKTAYNFAKSKGYDNPYSVEADKMFKKESIKLIKKYPITFAKKIAHNFFSIFYRGVYTGEYANTFISIPRRMEIDNINTSKSGLFNKISYISNLKTLESIPIIIEKLIQALFMLILFAMFLIIIFSLWKKTYKKYQYIFWIVIPIILYKFFIVSFIQYEYRHINAIYLLIFALFLLFIENSKESKVIDSNNPTK